MPDFKFHGWLYHAFIRGNDLTNAQKQYPEARHTTLQSNTHKKHTTLYYFWGITPPTSITWFELGF